jgi:hypothetical protein
MTVTLGKLRRGEAINFGGRPDRPRTKLLDFESMPSGKLLGWASVLVLLSHKTQHRVFM